MVQVLRSLEGLAWLSSNGSVPSAAGGGIEAAVTFTDWRGSVIPVGPDIILPDGNDAAAAAAIATDGYEPLPARHAVERGMRLWREKGERWSGLYGREHFGIRTGVHHSNHNSEWHRRDPSIRQIGEDPRYASKLFGLPVATLASAYCTFNGF